MERRGGLTVRGPVEVGDKTVKESVFKGRHQTQPDQPRCGCCLDKGDQPVFKVRTPVVLHCCSARSSKGGGGWAKRQKEVHHFFCPSFVISRDKPGAEDEGELAACRLFADGRKGYL